MLTKKGSRSTDSDQIQAGEACQKQDVSKQFVLLAATTFGLVLIAIGSVLYLLNEGQQELPSVLAGISVPK